MTGRVIPSSASCPSLLVVERVTSAPFPVPVPRGTVMIGGGPRLPPCVVRQPRHAGRATECSTFWKTLLRAAPGTSAVGVHELLHSRCNRVAFRPHRCCVLSESALHPRCPPHRLPAPGHGFWICDTCPLRGHTAYVPNCVCNRHTARGCGCDTMKSLACGSQETRPKEHV